MFHHVPLKQLWNYNTLFSYDVPPSNAATSLQFSIKLGRGVFSIPWSHMANAVINVRNIIVHDNANIILQKRYFNYGGTDFTVYYSLNAFKSALMNIFKSSNFSSLCNSAEAYFYREKQATILIPPFQIGKFFFFSFFLREIAYITIIIIIISTTS